MFELDIDPARDKLTLTYPITIIVQAAPDALLHDGDPNLLGHVAAGGTPVARSVNGFNTNWVVPPEVHAVTNALRDAEILVERIPASCIVTVHDVF